MLLLSIQDQDLDQEKTGERDPTHHPPKEAPQMSTNSQRQSWLWHRARPLRKQDSNIMIWGQIYWILNKLKWELYWMRLIWRYRRRSLPLIFSVRNSLTSQRWRKGERTRRLLEWESFSRRSGQRRWLRMKITGWTTSFIFILTLREPMM